LRLTIRGWIFVQTVARLSALTRTGYPTLISSIGHTLRIGASGDFRRSPLTIAGFFCLGIVEYALFAPVYWFMLLKGLSTRGKSEPPSDPPPGDSPAAAD